MAEITVERARDRPSLLLEAHGVIGPSGLRIQRLEPTVPALVLGSRQRSGNPVVVDIDRCHRSGIEVTARRSGGGVVLVVPGEILWVDITIPIGDPRFEPDVIAAMYRTGRWWERALIECGVDTGRLAVNEGGECTTPWSRIVCFAGLGPGEITLDGDKLLGISQRRTRNGSRFQCAVHLLHDQNALPALLIEPRLRPEELGRVATLRAIAGDVDGLADAVMNALVDVIGTNA